MPAPPTTAESQKIFAFVVLMITITALTWTLGVLDIKYKVDADIAFSNGFPGDTALWKRAGDWSNVLIDDTSITVNRKTSNRSIARRDFVLPDLENRSAQKLRVRGTIENSGQIQKEADEPGAAYMVWLVNQQQEVIQYLTVMSLTGTQDTYQAERIVSIPDAANSFSLILNSRDAQNGFRLSDASAQIISDTPIYRIAGALLIAVWLLIIFMCGRWLYQHASRALFLIASSLVTAIIIGVMLPESTTDGLVNPMFQAIADFFPSFDTSAAQSTTYKIGHFLFFFLISLVVLYNASSLHIGSFTLTLILVLFAIASEGVQLHLFNRTTRLSDIAIDIGGILLAAILVYVFMRAVEAQ